MQTSSPPHHNTSFELLLDKCKRISLRTGGLWLLFANLCFALFLLGRSHLTVLLSAQQNVILTGSEVDKLSIIFLVFFVFSLFLIPFIRSQIVAMALTFLTGLYWAVIFHFMLDNEQPALVFPLFCMLIFTALIALYPSMTILYSFTAPLWTSMFAHLVFLRADIPVFEVIGMMIVSVLFETGRIMLSRWFVLSVRRECDNAQLLSALDNLAHNDPLTGVANRRQLDSLLEAQVVQANRDSTTFSVIMIDVDFFKKYNDLYGHQAGDTCLVSIAECFKAAVRQTGDLVARYGGEEFVILLGGTAADDAIAVASRIKQHVDAAAIPHALSQTANVVTVSQGIMEWRQGMTSLKLLKCADQALYAAKNAGRNRWQIG